MRMFWSIPIGVIAGTVVKLHITFILFLVWLAGMQWTMADSRPRSISSS